MNYKLRGNFSLDPDEGLNDMLVARGVAPEDLEKFKNPSRETCEIDWHNLDNIEDGVELLHSYLAKNARICFVIDADADGFTSSAIIWSYIKELYPNADLSFKCQEGKRHGLKHLTSTFVYDDHYDLVVCPDSSTNDVEYIKQIRESGTSVLVIDHHDADEGVTYDCYPDGCVLINNMMSEKYSNKQLCGAGMAYKFCQALDCFYGVSLADKFLDLTALGEVADIMNKTNVETNYLIEEGLKHLKTPIISHSLVANSRDGKNFPFERVTSNDLAFIVGPLINSVTRMGTVEDNELMFRAFVDPYAEEPSTKYHAKPGEYESNVEHLVRYAKNTCKKNQDQIKRDSVVAIANMVSAQGRDKHSIVIVSLPNNSSIPPSIRGVIAAELVDYYGKPIMIGSESSDGSMLNGSIRGNDNFKAVPNFKEFLEGSGLMEYIAGHANAAGFSVKTKNIDKLLEYADAHIDLDGLETVSVVDYVLDNRNASTFPLLWNIAHSLRYFGNGLDDPLVVLTNFSAKNFQVMGKDMSTVKINHNHVDLIRFKDLDFVDQIENAPPGTTLTVMGKLSINYFNGNEYLQLKPEIVEYNAGDYDF